MRLPPFLTRVAGTLLACAFCAAAQAQSVPIAVAPVTVKLDTAAQFSSVEVGNRGEADTGVEASVMRVRIGPEGNELYEPTQDFVVSPPTFRLLAGKSRMVRFHYSGKRESAEVIYRLFLKQLPEAQAPGQVTMVFNIGVPIFVAPPSAEPRLALRKADGKAAELRNTGNVTLTIKELDGKGCTGTPAKFSARLFPGQFTPLPADAACASAASTDRGLLPLEPG